MKLALTFALCIISCIYPVVSTRNGEQTKLGEVSVIYRLAQLDKDVAAYEKNPSRGEMRLIEMLDEMTSPEYLKNISTPLHISAAQRKESELDNALIRAIIMRAKLKASTSGSPKLHFTATFLDKFKFAATKV
jgi:hypothetical protein